MKHRKLLTVVSWITISLSAALMALVIFWLFYPYNPIEFKSPFVVNNTTIPQGSYFTYSFNACKYSSIEPLVKREFVNDIIFESTDTRANVKVGCNTVTVVQKVPSELPTGNYRFRVTVTYKMNPMRSITYVNETNEFTVTKGE